ncbi:MAG: alpha/beta hydrolase [Eubacteriales bacterium]|nr:alpha/beta hydrolase [Eubacteriales bacterium]
MDIRCTQSVYHSADGRSLISCYAFCPVGIRPRGIVQIAHGMCEYFSRYTQFAKYLCSQGFLVCGNDHLGHGSSVPPGGALGFFGQKNGWSVLVDDLATLTDKTKARWPDLPYFLFGHSMGAMTARLYLTRYVDKLDGCIFSGTPSNNPMAGAGIHIANSVIHSQGPMYRSFVLNNLATGRYNSRIKNPKSPFDWLTRDRTIVSLYQSDEKCNFIFTAAGFRDLCRLAQRCAAPQCVTSVPGRIPLLFVSGDADPVGNYGVGVRRIASAYKSAGFTDIHTILYPDCRHEVLNELNHVEVYHDISDWLEQHLPQEADGNPNE